MQKIILKRDFEILNHCIAFDENDKMLIRYNPKQMIRQSGVRGNSTDDDKSSKSSSGPV